MRSSRSRLRKGIGSIFRHRVIVPDGRLFISLLKQRDGEDFNLDQVIAIYDPATNEFHLDAVDLPVIQGERHPLLVGRDGMVYALGNLPDKGPATAVQVDPYSLATDFYGPIGPSHGSNPTWAYTAGLDDRYIYIASGKIPWFLVAYDRQERTWETLLETESVGGYIGLGQREGGVDGSGWGFVNTEIGGFAFWLHEGKVVPKDGNARPWPDQAPLRNDPPKPSVDLGLAGADLDGNVEFSVQWPDQTSRVFTTQVPMYAQPIYRLHELPEGYSIAALPGADIFGTAGAYQGNFAFDSSSGSAKHIGRIGLSHYCTAFCNGKIYMSGYPRSPLYEYDPSKAWNTGTVVNGEYIDGTQASSNPRLIVSLGEKELAGTHKMYAGATGADNKVYFGGKWWRDGDAGGLAWYEPDTGEFGGFWEALSNYQVSHMATARGGELIVLSTWRVDDPVLGKPIPDEGALFTFDTVTGELSSPFAPIADIVGTGPIVAADDRQILGWASHPADENRSLLYLVDVISLELVYLKEIPFRMPVSLESERKEPWDFRLGKDGVVWTFFDDVLVRITPSDGTVEAVGRVEPGQIAFSGGNVYLGGQNQIRLVSLPSPDTELPVISGMPGDILTVKEPESAGAVVTWETPMATDNVGVVEFSSTHDSGTLFTVGSTTVSYTAIDAAGNVTTASFKVTVIERLTPQLSWENPGAISFGTALGAVQLNASANVPGSFSYEPGAGTVLSAGQGQTLKVNFTPTDTFQYSAASATVVIDVDLAVPAISWNQPAPITYGNALGAAELNATVSDVAGAFVYFPPAGTVLNAGTSQGLMVTFTPSDTNYAVATKTVGVDVASAPLTITADDKQRPPGDVNPPLTLSYSGFVNGDTEGVLNEAPTLSTTATIGSEPGVYPIEVSGASSENYKITFVNGSLTVTARRIPVITWTEPVPITYGTPLSDAQLNAKADTRGTLAYTPPIDSVLGAGTGKLLKVTFLPADPTAYDTVTASVTLDVARAALTITASDAERPVGMPNPTFTVDYTGFVPGDTPEDLVALPTLVTTANEASAPGVYPIAPSGATASNYDISYVPGTLAVIEDRFLSVGAASVRFLRGDTGDGVLMFRWLTLKGETYRVEGSSDLLTWTPLTGMDSIVAESDEIEREVPFPRTVFYIRAVRLRR